MHLHQLEKTDAVHDRAAAELVTAVQGGLVAPWQVTEQAGAVVASDVVDRAHGS